MKVIFKVADRRDPVRTYQLEHRSGAKINVVEDGIDSDKYGDGGRTVGDYEKDFDDSSKSETTNIVIHIAMLSFITITLSKVAN